MKEKNLHENISEEEILFALVVEEVDEACILTRVLSRTRHKAIRMAEPP